MTVRAKNSFLLAGVVAAIVAVAALLPMIASSDLDKRRDVHLVIRDMAFYLEGKGEPNPPLHFRAGEKVRLVITSEDAGMEHDFVVRKWKVATRTIQGRGEEAVSFKVPRKRGTDTYFCTPHAVKMRGTIHIE